MHNFSGCFQGFFSMEKINIKRPSFFLVVILYCTCVPTFSSLSALTAASLHILLVVFLSVLKLEAFRLFAGGLRGWRWSQIQRQPESVVFLLHDTYSTVVLVAFTVALFQ
jgi:hypothetical protein